MDAPTPCQLNEEPFKQCCCNCKHHRQAFHHCTTNRPLRQEMGGKCICNVSAGWVCDPPEFDAVFVNWPEHSVGCEMYDPTT